MLTPGRPTGGRLGAGAEHRVAISGVGAERAAAIRPFLPFQTKPVQIFEHGRNKFRFATGTIQVLVAQDKDAAASVGSLLRGPECSGVTEMEKAGGRGREPAAIRVRD